MPEPKGQLRERIWALVEPSLKGYGDMIDRLMDHMNKDQLKAVLARIHSQDEDPDEDEPDESAAQAH